MTLPVGTSAAPAVVAKLSTLDRLLPVWIGVAMLAGLLLGRYVLGIPAIRDATPEQLAVTIGPVLQHYLTGPLGGTVAFAAE